jgi:hypothetical protein
MRLRRKRLGVSSRTVPLINLSDPSPPIIADIGMKIQPFMETGSDNPIVPHLISQKTTPTLRRKTLQMTYMNAILQPTLSKCTRSMVEVSIH